MELKFGLQPGYDDNKVFVRTDHYARNESKRGMPVPQVISDEVREKLFVEGNYTDVKGGRYLSTDKLLEVAASPDGLFQVLNLLRHETGNVANEVMSVNFGYKPEQNEALLPIINNYNAMLRAINKILKSLEPEITGEQVSVSVHRAKNDIVKSLSMLERELKGLTEKVTSTTDKRT